MIGAKDRETNQVAARAIPKVNREVLLDFVDSVTDPDATVYTDGSSAYRGRENHESVSHSSGEYVRGDVHTNGVESLWAILKRAYMGTHHWMSPKHLQRYVNELCGRHNIPRHGHHRPDERGRGRDGREAVAVPEAGGRPASQRTADVKEAEGAWGGQTPASPSSPNRGT